MKKQIAFLALGIFSLSAIALGGTKDAVFVVMGGRTSCGSASPAPSGIGMYKPFLGMLDILKKKHTDTNFHYLVSCLNTSPPPNGEAQFITSDDPALTQYGDASELRSRAEKYATAYGDETAVFVIGHSYGGWLAMYLGETSLFKTPIAGLISVDPISPRCGPAQVVFGGIECRQAPRELDNRKILSQTEKWVNFYQDQDVWLHSSSIPEAENVRVGYRGPHTQIDMDKRTWAKIQSVVEASLK